MNYERKDFMGERMMDVEKITEIAHKTLLRSKSALLSLKIVSDTYEMTDSTPLTSLVLTHAHRIQYLELKIFAGGQWYILSSPYLVFDHLEFLSLSSFEHDEFPDVIQSALFQKAPQLRVAEIDLSLDWSTMAPHLPWANLEYLSMTKNDDLSPRVAHRVIRQCPNLIVLQINLFTDDETTDSIPPATFPFMTTLLVEMSGCITIADFLRPCILPRLTRLELRTPYEEDYYPS